MYHLHDPELLPWGLLLRAVTRRPVIYDSHEFLAESILSKHWIPVPFRRPLARLSDRMEKAIARRLDVVVVVTDEMADRFAPVQPCTVVVMNLPRFAGAPPERRPDAVYAGP